MFGLTPAHLVIILVIALVVIGPGKLPEVGAAMGKSIREFQKASSGVQESVASALTQPAPQAPAGPAQAPMIGGQPAPQHVYYAQQAYPSGQPAPVYQAIASTTGFLAPAAYGLAQYGFETAPAAPGHTEPTEAVQVLPPSPQPD